MLNELNFTIADIHAAYAKGTAVGDVIRESFRRLEQVNDDGIYIHLADEAYISAAIVDLGEMDLAAKPLWGIPFAVKDNIDVAGMPTTAACPEYAYAPEQDADVVARLKAAGAIVIGKTNLDQFATGLVGVRTPYPAPKNAVDPQFVPGGSSAGSAVAVGHGQVCFSLGTDTAGSGRVPAALNNIIGLKPSLGALSNQGVVPACLTLDTVSIFATTMADAEQAFAACRQDKPIAVGANSDHAVHDLVIGVPSRETLVIDGDVALHAYDAAVAYWSSQGATIKELDFTPFYDVAHLLYDGPWVVERYAAIEDFFKQQPQVLHPVTRSIIKGAEAYSAVDVFRGIYKLAALEKRIFGNLQDVDLLCVPTMPGFVTCAAVESDPIGPNKMLGTYTNFVNLLRMCAIAVPGQQRSDGLPSSITLIARDGQDRMIHGLAKQFHTEFALCLDSQSPKISKQA